MRAAFGLPGIGTSTWLAAWRKPLSSKFVNIGAMRFRLTWQLAQMTADVSWKSIFAFGVLSLPVMLSYGNAPVNVPLPSGFGVGRVLRGELRAREGLLDEANAAEGHVREVLREEARVGEDADGRTGNGARRRTRPA